MSPIVDAHTHLGLAEFVVKPISEEKRKRPAFRDPMENRIEDLLSRMDADGVSKAVAFPYPLEEVDAVLANTYVFEASRAHPDRIVPFALVGDDVERWLALGARGFKQHDILQAPERFDLARAYRLIAAEKVPLLVHLRSRDPLEVTTRVKSILGAALDLRIILGHMGRHTPNTAEHVDDNLAGLRSEPNVYFETSTVRDPAAIKRAVDLLGPDRVLFGSDNPFNSYQDADPLGVEIETLRRAGLAPRVERQVLGENLERLLGI